MDYGVQVSWSYMSFLDFGCPDMNIDPITGDYYPSVFFNEFWLLRDKLIPLNETVTELPLNLEVGPISMTKWQLFLQIDQSFQIHRSYGSMLEGEADELKVRYFKKLSQLCIINPWCAVRIYCRLNLFVRMCMFDIEMTSSFTL